MSTSSPRIRNPWSWVPTSYLAEGIPFAMVIWVAGTMFKDLGHSDGEMTLAKGEVALKNNSLFIKPISSTLKNLNEENQIN